MSHLGIRGTVIALGIIWGFSVVIAVPTAVNFDVVVDDQNNNDSNRTYLVCESTWNDLQTSINSLFLLVVSYLVPQVQHLSLRPISSDTQRSVRQTSFLSGCA